eukprot:scaffold324392_cov53-Tisochrysis_lutea.AAC.3
MAKGAAAAAAAAVRARGVEGCVRDRAGRWRRSEAPACRAALAIVIEGEMDAGYTHVVVPGDANTVDDAHGVEVAERALGVVTAEIGLQLDDTREGTARFARRCGAQRAIERAHHARLDHSHGGVYADRTAEPGAANIASAMPEEGAGRQVDAEWHTVANVAIVQVHLGQRVAILAANAHRIDIVGRRVVAVAHL